MLLLLRFAVVWECADSTAFNLWLLLLLLLSCGVAVDVVFLFVEKLRGNYSTLGCLGGRVARQ